MAKAPDRTPWDGIIVTDAETCFGKPRIAGTRIYVDLILEKIEDGSSIDDILRDNDHLSRSQLQSAIGFARDLVANKCNRLRSERHPPAPALETNEDHG